MGEEKEQLKMDEIFEVRDMRIKEKFQIDDDYLNGYAKKCGIYATGVYVSLCRHANREQECYPSMRKIAEELAISEKQVGRAIKILEKHMIIFKRRMGKKLNNRYILLDKSNWTHSPITTDSQSDHIGTDSPIHSKDTHLRITHKKDRTITPAEEMKLFLEDDVYFNKVVDVITEKYKAPREMVLDELTKFKSYWSEKNGSGKKQRWELQKTFEVGRRIGTWFRNINKFNQQKSKGKIIHNTLS